MYSYKKTNLPKKTIEIELTIPWADIEKKYDESFEALRKELKTEGFRQGKAPKKIAESKISRDKVYDHLIRKIIPEIYTEIVKKEDIKPIISPKIELTKAKEKEEWVIKLKTAETPDVVLGNYKEKAKKASSEVKKSDIWVPGKDKEISKEEKEKQDRMIFQAKLDAVLGEAKAEVSDLIVEDEVNSRLSKLVDDISKVGLTMDAYLSSKNLTKEKLNEMIRKEIEDTYRLEFVLQKIADEEKIKIEEAELKKLFESFKTEKEKETAQKNLYYYASLMRKQKTLDYINSL